MFFRKKKKSYGNTGQVSSNYTPKYVSSLLPHSPTSSTHLRKWYLTLCVYNQHDSYMQPMPNQQTAPSWGVTPAAPPLSHYGAAGLQPPVYHDAGAGGGAYAAPPALPSRPLGGAPATHKPLPTPPGYRAPAQCPPPLPAAPLGSSHSAVYHTPPQHHYGHHGGLDSSHSAVVGSHYGGEGLGHHDAAYTYQQPA
jgi:hypothetical protein